MPCSILMHLPALSISCSFEHIVSLPSTQNNPYPLKVSTDEFSLRGQLPKPLSRWYFKLGPPGGINILPHCNPSASNSFRVILVGNTQSDSGLAQPLHHVFSYPRVVHDSPQHYFCGGFFELDILLAPTHSPTLLILLRPIPTWSLLCSLCHKTSLLLSPICDQDIMTFWMCLKREMKIGYRLINPMIAQSNSKMAHIHHLVPSMR